MYLIMTHGMTKASQLPNLLHKGHQKTWYVKHSAHHLNSMQDMALWQKLRGGIIMELNYGNTL